MGTYGGLAPGAERYGGGGRRRLVAILDSLNQQRGTAIDTSQTSPAYAENTALARSLDNAWATNTRLGNLANPAKTTDVPRHERMLGIVPRDGDTMVTRRARIIDRWARFGTMATPQEISDVLTTALGPLFVQIHRLTPANAVSFTSPWYSTIAHLAVELTLPATATVGDIVAATNTIGDVLDGRLPAWSTWSWFLKNGAGALGFRLDDPQNLATEAFA